MSILFGLLLALLSGGDGAAYGLTVIVTPEDPDTTPIIVDVVEDPDTTPIIVDSY